MASDRLNAKKSVSGSGRSTRNGKTISRVMGRACSASPESEGTSSVWRRSWAMASAVWYRSSGFLASARWMTRSTAAMAADPLRTGGFSCVIAWITCAMASPMNGGLAVSIS